MNRSKQIPGGIRWVEPATKFTIRPWSSFDSAVQQIIAHRQGNPALAARFGWATDYNNVAAELDAYNSAICAQMGWQEYIVADGGQPIPFPQPQFKTLKNRLQNVVAGSETILDWIKSGAEAVPAELSAERSKVCATCPFNSKGDLLKFFTVPVTQAIRAALDSAKGMNLSTPHDAEINVCSICDCPLKLKVHIPIEAILAKLPKETLPKLPEFCWIQREQTAGNE